MTNQVITEELLGGFDPLENGMLTMDGYNDCIIGAVEQFGRPPIVCYDINKVIAKMVSDGMTEEESWEFYSYNQLGSWVGESTPCFLYPSIKD